MFRFRAVGESENWGQLATVGVSRSWLFPGMEPRSRRPVYRWMDGVK